MKKIITICGAFFLTQVAFAQFTGTNPSTLNDNGYINGKLGIGTTSMPRLLNLRKTMTGLPAFGAPVEAYTTGLRITHKWRGTSFSPYVEYRWDIGGDYNRLDFYYLNTNTRILTLHKNGNVGIGEHTPTYKLHVKNTSTTSGTAIRAEAINGQIRIFETDGSAPTVNFTQIERNGNAFHIYQKDAVGYKHVLTATEAGDVGIGTTNPQGYKLAVKGDMIAEKVVVKLYANWPDYVFTKNYGLMGLDEVESYIKENSHLPNVPSAKEVEEGGIDLGKMDAILLQKIEELTLYVIELKKENKAQQLQNDEQQKIIDSLMKK